MGQGNVCRREPYRTLKTSWWLSILAGFVCFEAISGAVTERSHYSMVVSDDGAWCWFQDPRAVYLAGRRERTYTGWMTRKGALQLGAFDHRSGDIETMTLEPNWDADDHNTCSLLVLPDRRLMVFYARHNKEGLFCRISSDPESILRWEDEVMVSDEDRITYSHPVYLRAEKKFYVFWRGPSWKPTFATSLNGKQWTQERILIQGRGKEANSIRPYLKVYSKGDSVIHFTFTDGHPRNESTNSVYYLSYRDGAFFKADGGHVASLSEVPVDHRESDLVYKPHQNSGRAWVWGVSENSKGHPVIVYTRYPSESEHYYHYAYWEERWKDCEMVNSGRWFPETPEGRKESEPHYSGGLAICDQDPSLVYLSRQVDGQFEIERWRKDPVKCDWKVEAITGGSGRLNVRPVVPWGAPSEKPIVLWMRGTYEHYTRYQTQILLNAGTKNW